jgi:hypothetical protein
VSSLPMRIWRYKKINQVLQRRSRPSRYRTRNRRNHRRCSRRRGLQTNDCRKRLDRLLSVSLKPRRHRPPQDKYPGSR